MVTNMLNIATILSLIIFLSLQSQRVLSTDVDVDVDVDVEEEYVLDNPFANTRLRSRFLASIKKGTRCDAKTNNVCNGISANKGTGILYCCKKHCRNVLSDRNNCGQCGHKCGIGQLCCGGTCTSVAYNAANCGKCGRTCSSGLSCVYGFCGYA